MKHYISCLLLAGLLVCSPAAVKAQKNTYYHTRHEIGVTVGVDGTTQLFSGMVNLMEIMVSATVTTAMTGGMATGYYNYGDKKNTPAFSLEYYYHLNKVVGLGGFLGYNGMSRDMLVKWTDNTTGKRHTDKSGEARVRNYSIIPTAKFDWMRKKHFGMYSKLGLGVSFIHETQKDDLDGGTDESDTDLLANFQLSLLGMEFGSQHIRGFVELGVGEQGFALAGLKYKF